MKYTTAIFVFFHALVAFARADSIVGPGCSADASMTARPSASWSTGDGKINQIFDITVRNDGSCPLANVGLTFDFPESATITQEWNLMADSRYLLLTNFGPSIATGASATAGVVVSVDQANAADLTGSAVHVYGAACPASCVNGGSNPTAAPSSAPSNPTAAPSSAPSNPTSAPTTPSGPVPNCQGNAQAVARAQAPWTDAQGYSYQIYDVIANNTGTCPWTTIAAFFTGNITQSWNYDIPSGLLSGYGSNGVAAGQVYSSAGFVVATSPTPVAGTPSAPVLGRMVTRCGAPCSA